MVPVPELEVDDQGVGVGHGDQGVGRLDAREKSRVGRDDSSLKERRRRKEDEKNLLPISIIPCVHSRHRRKALYSVAECELCQQQEYKRRGEQVANKKAIHQETCRRRHLRKRRRAASAPT